MFYAAARVPVVNISSSSSSCRSSAASVPTKTGYAIICVHILYVYILCVHNITCMQVYCILCSGTLARKLVRRDKKKKNNNCIPVYYRVMTSARCDDCSVPTYTDFDSDENPFHATDGRFSWWEKL